MDRRISRFLDHHLDHLQNRKMVVVGHIQAVADHIQAVVVRNQAGDNLAADNLAVDNQAVDSLLVVDIPAGRHNIAVVDLDL